MMLPTKGLTEKLPDLVLAKENLENICKNEPPSLSDLKFGIISLKSSLKDVEDEILKYRIESSESREAKRENLDGVYNAMSEAENVLLPEDYSLDILLFNLMKGKRTFLLKMKHSHIKML